ncbi:MAG: Glycogen debranching enzyme (Alpha-1,6-glucosidase) [uncultured Truepera sp.]|uniref:Glycogen debranching enzyme (Alpha-1,6-glucosidase) n=1 Tax=uncultured Truepera sp. TaxID=543023 RepID=A0A6J4VF42_9DEIN|nr:MAG: Glycogen debranching enzyme (Alpha-1,6-glucosidase) [uncultured Truepera sp.]
MDLSKDVVLKENYTFFVADAAGQVQSGEHGLYNRDTRFLSRYAWDFGKGVEALLVHTPRPDMLETHYARIEGPSQVVGVRRRLTLTANSLTDRLELENSSLEPRSVTLQLTVAGDFVDMFEARGWQKLARQPVTLQREGDLYALRYRAQDGLEVASTFQPSQPPDEMQDGTLLFKLELAPKEKAELSVTVRLETLGEDQPEIPYDAWMTGFEPLPELSGRHQHVLNQAQQDLRALLLFTEHGPYPAAGIPWYVATFGRDALLAASMLLPHHPEVAEGVLRYLAAHQGQKHDPVTAEAPGKIMHELRYGELTRLGRVPFGPYYGTVDATPLFVTLFHQHYRLTGNSGLVKALRPHWEAALTWMTETADRDGDGFLEFVGEPVGQGLSIQTWKDSFDSMSHRDGRLAEGAIAGSEVQGYAYAAYLAAADFYEALQEADAGTEAAAWRNRAEALKGAFHERFWLPELQTYALALDGDKRPLKVHNSNAGHLLWTGIVPDGVAPKLVQTLFSETNWSGWGVRTLGASEARYNPVSYHNGSVWPHDTALMAGGLARYGFRDEAARIREALFDLASSQGDGRLPELVAGYGRSAAPPVPYPVACRPQAWDAAALLYLLTL